MLFKNAIDPHTLELLKKLQATKELKGFFPAGGTALALHIGHRKSIDLALFTQNDFDNNFLLEFLEQNFNFKLDFSAINTLKGSIDGVKIDLISHKYPFVKPILKNENIFLFSIEDIAAMKLNAIAGNGTRSKDFIDIYFVLKQFSLENLLDFYKTKYETRNLLHVVKSLNYFDDINTQDWPELIIDKKLKLSQIKNEIEKQIKIFFNNI